MWLSREEGRETYLKKNDGTHAFHPYSGEDIKNCAAWKNWQREKEIWRPTIIDAYLIEFGKRDGVGIHFQDRAEQCLFDLRSRRAYFQIC